MCREKFQIAFNTLLWTLDPRQRAGYRNLPFILRPNEEKAVDAVREAIDTPHDLLFDKSRDEGATCTILGVFFLYDLLVPESMFLVGSRKEEFVDKGGDHKCLFYKLMYMNDHLPSTIRPQREKTHLHYANLDNGSMIDGEATNESMGAGDRRLAVMVDEFGRVDHKLAQNIRETLSDTTDCVIYNSTHFYGRDHPFAELRYSGKIKVFLMPWWKNPVKNKGLYKSPDLNVIEIQDGKYYEKKFPSAGIKGTLKYSELEIDMLTAYPEAKLSLIADGANKWRSPWYDKECLRRDPRDVAQNLDMNPVASGDIYFDPMVLLRIRDEFVRPADYAGEIEFNVRKGKIVNECFKENAGCNRFEWWGELINNRPNQKHNYIVACDISFGMGASNSVAKVYNVNTHELVGSFVCPNTSAELFADQTIAICKWAGGATRKAYLIWESNGGAGGSFGKRIRLHGYSFVYSNTNERIPYRPRGKESGWHSDKKSKDDLLFELKIALNEGLKKDLQYKALIVHDKESVSEYERYSFLRNGSIGIASRVDDVSGAKAAHGDRVIPDGLFILALSDQPRAAMKEMESIRNNSMSARALVRKREEQKSLENKKWLY